MAPISIHPVIKSFILMAIEAEFPTLSADNYSYCWPRDWLETDSVMRDRVRVIGVDFDTSVSQWGNSCPTESFQTSLVDRSDEILNKLKRSGVGQRPVVFVGHSMGGKLPLFLTNNINVIVS